MGRLCPRREPRRQADGTARGKASSVEQHRRPGATKPFRLSRLRDARDDRTQGGGSVVLGRVKLWGLPAWLVWVFAHLYFLIGFRNRLVVMVDWAWAYFSLPALCAHRHPGNARVRPRVHRAGGWGEQARLIPVFSGDRGAPSISLHAFVISTGHCGRLSTNGVAHGHQKICRTPQGRFRTFENGPRDGQEIVRRVRIQPVRGQGASSPRKPCSRSKSTPRSRRRSSIPRCAAVLKEQDLLNGSRKSIVCQNPRRGPVQGLEQPFRSEVHRARGKRPPSHQGRGRGDVSQGQEKEAGLRGVGRADGDREGRA